MGMISNYLRYGEENYNGSYGVVEKFEGQPFYYYRIEKDGSINKIKIEKYKLHRNLPTYRDGFERKEYWYMYNGRKIYIKSDDFGKFSRCKIVTFVDDDKAVMKFIRQGFEAIRDHNYKKFEESVVRYDDICKVTREFEELLED